MSDINTAVLSGGLTRDPELRQFDRGGCVLGFGLGVSETFRASDGQTVERSHYIDVDVYGRRAEALAQILRKGMRVTVQGHLAYSSWEKDGQRRSKLTLVADEISLPPRPKDGPQAAQDAPCAAPAPECGGYAYGAYDAPQAPAYAPQAYSEPPYGAGCAPYGR